MNTDKNSRPLSLATAPRVLCILAAAAFSGPALSAAVQPTTPCGRVEIAPVVNIPVGKSTVIRPDAPVRRILLGNPENVQAARPATTKPDKNGADDQGAAGERPGVAAVDVLLLSPTEIYLLGKSVGSTNIVLVNRDGACTALDVNVAMDVTAVQSVLAELMPEEKDIKVSSAYDSLVLTGSVADATQVDRAVEIATAYVRKGSGGAGGAGGASATGTNPRVVNLLQVAAPQQVLLQVKVAEVSKTLLDKLGASFSGARINGWGTISLLADFLSTSPLGGTVGIHKPRSWDATLEAENKNGLVKILAEPNVMAISGQEGSFLAGGKIFIPVAQSSTTGTQTITLEEKEFGVSLRFTPTVLAGGRINLKVAPEVSELNPEGIGLSAPGITGTAILPSFTTRRAATTVQLRDGQSFAIGGLIKNNVTTNIRAFPFLGEIPILGALFRSTDFQTDRSELVFVVTPRLVKPLPPDYTLPTDNYIEPTPGQVLLGGKLEGSAPRGAPQAPAGEPGSSADPVPNGGFELNK